MKTTAHGGMQFFMLLLSSAALSSKLTFSKNSFWNTITVSNRLDPDQKQHYVGPDLGSNCQHTTSMEKLILQDHTLQPTVLKTDYHWGPPQGFWDLGRMAICFQGAGEHW